MGGCPITTGSLAAQIEPFKLLEAISTLVIDLPSLSSEEYIDAPIAIANVRLSLSSMHTESAWSVGLGTWRVAVGRAGQTNDAAGSAGRDSVLVDQVLSELAAPCWPYSLFENVLQHMLIAREVGHQLLKLLVLGLELLQAP